MIIHSEPRPHVGELCECRVKRLGELRDYIKIHTGEKDVCGPVVFQKFNLENHRKRDFSG